MLAILEKQHNIMKKYLFAIDVQPEFVNDSISTAKYNKCLKYISHAKDYVYDKVYAVVYSPDENFLNMRRYLHWHCPETFLPLEFEADVVLYHDGYSIQEYPDLYEDDQVDIVGADTDACVLSTAFNVFNLGCSLRIIQNLCWSSGGEVMHDTALKIMQRQFGDAVTTIHL